MVQTIVRNALREAVPGGLGDSGFHDIISRDAEETNGIPFGYAVVPGTDIERQTSLPSTTGVGLLGVAARDNKEQQFSPTLGVNEYDDEDTVGILRVGRIWVFIWEDIVAGDAVRFWHAAGATALPGQFGTTTEAADSSLISVGARYVKGGTAVEGIALLELSPAFTVVDE